MSYSTLDPKGKARLHHVLVDAIDETFRYSDWVELASHTGTSEYVEKHPRLLRSLDFGDEDYRGHAIQAIRHILEAAPENLHIVMQFGSIAQSIRTKHPDFDLDTLLVPGIPFFSPDVGELYRNGIQALEDARRHVVEGRVASAVDRMHTVLHGYFRRIAEEHNLISDPRIAENASSLLNTLLDKHPAFEYRGNLKTEIQTVRRSMRKIGDALNTVRNESLAHPHDFILGTVEAQLFIDTMNTLLHYVHGTITEWGNKQRDNEDEVPF